MNRIGLFPPVITSNERRENRHGPKPLFFQVATDRLIQRGGSRIHQDRDHGERTGALRLALQPIGDKQLQLLELEQRGEELSNDEQRLAQDQIRLRENMKALRGSKEEKALRLHYARTLAGQEDRMVALREQIREVTQRRVMPSSRKSTAC